MLSCQKLWFLFVALLLLSIPLLEAKSLAKAADEPTIETSIADVSKLSLISTDVIHDEIEKDTKKVIRVNPLDLPPLKQDPNILNMDSSLYKIQPHKPHNNKREYTNIQRVNKKKTPSYAPSDSPIIKGFSLLTKPHDKMLKPKHQPKKKNLHFLYNQKDLAGNLLSKSMPVHVAPGAYPVYYVVAKTNGRFGKYPLKSFENSRDFMKYLQKTKIEKMPDLERFEKEIVQQ